VLHGVLDSNFKLCAFVVNELINREIEKPSGQFLGLIVMSHDLVRFEFESRIVSFYFSFFFVSFGESCLLVSRCAGGRCGMTCSDEGRGRSRRPIAEDRGWSHRSSTRWPGDREVGWHHVRSAPCTWRRGVRVSYPGSKKHRTEASIRVPRIFNHTHSNNMINR
jgi:hypothetical protein